jgi:MFS family permease
MYRHQLEGNKTRSSNEGAGIGLLAATLFVVAFIVFLTTGPTGDPGFPDIANAQFAPGYFAENLNAIRIVTLLTALGITLFLWFLATIWTKFREAEGAPERGSAIALIGGVVGSVLILIGLALTASAALSTSPEQAANVPTLYVASALLTAFGGGVFSIFFVGVAKVIFQTRAVGKWLGWLAVAAAVLSACAFMTPFFTAEILNAATGALGRWSWTAGLVVWLLFASGALLVQRRREAPRPSAPSAAPEPSAPEVMS